MSRTFTLLGFFWTGLAVGIICQVTHGLGLAAVLGAVVGIAAGYVGTRLEWAR